jgi:hypothetical protein
MISMKPIEKLFIRYKATDKNLKFFLFGVLFLGANSGILNSSFNNYLYEIFSLSSQQRGFLELPREFPGFLVFFVTSIFYFISMRNWAVLVALISGIGILGIGVFSPTIAIMTLFVTLWSLGDHVFMTVESSVGLELSIASKEGKRLGQISGARNLAAILGSFIVYLGFSRLKFSYGVLYIIAFVFALLAAYNFSRMKLKPLATKQKLRFLYRKEYNLYYFLNILTGARKQIFLTFGPWVLISVFGTKPETIAILIIIASTLGVFFRQAFGELTDKFGEGKMLRADAIILLIICLGYAYSVNRYFLFSLYIIDNLMFATRIARTTYLNKITKDKTDLAPTISLGVTIDHVFSMTTPLLGGLLWAKFGYSSVFLATISVAILSYFAAAMIKYEKA